MTYQELQEKIREILPKADIQNDGWQIIIYTGIAIPKKKDDKLVELK